MGLLSDTSNHLQNDTKAGLPARNSNNGITPTPQLRSVVFLSSCPEPWGGSEELWAGAARRLSLEGCHVSAHLKTLDTSHPRIQELRVAGVIVSDVLEGRTLPLLRVLEGQELGVRLLKQRNRVKRFLHRVSGSLQRRLWFKQTSHLLVPDFSLVKRLRHLHPDLAVVSQGSNFDGIYYAEACRQAGVPYVLICQKASEFNWPASEDCPAIGRIFGEARGVFFVSSHNWKLTEWQIGRTLPDAEVVRNPFLTHVKGALPWPPTTNPWRLACVARLFVIEKGQDLLLRVLSQEKWRKRNLEINFFGEGMHRPSLERMAKMLELDNVHFCGFVKDMAGVFREHHALVLPSRAEGLPLALVEAMMCGRIGIVSDAGGTAEVVDDGVTGFVARGLTETVFDDALERAWNRRNEWKTMGQAAAQSIRQQVPSDPCGVFAGKLAMLHSGTRQP